MVDIPVICVIVNGKNKNNFASVIINKIFRDVYVKKNQTNCCRHFLYPDHLVVP